MNRYEFPAEDSIDKHVPPYERRVSVEYQGDTQVVKTEGPDEMTRQELYQAGERVGADLNWSGENAHTKEQMIDKLTEEAN
jgi:hypothetical protein